jgi:hypothetical protein
MHIVTRLARLASPLFLSAAACSSPAAQVSDAGSETSTFEPVYDEKGCQAPLGGILPGQVCVRTLKVKVVGEDGKPLVNLITTACGDGCTFGRTNAEGISDMEVRRYMGKAALMLHGRSKYASYYVRLQGLEGDVDKGTMILPLMPTEGVTIPEDGAATTLTSGDVKLTLPAGLKVEIDKMELGEVDEQKLRAKAVATDKAPPFVEASLGMAALYAFTPFGTILTPGVGVTVPNGAKLAPGAAVEFFVQGTDLDDKYGTFGGFTKLAEGHVSADGTTIQTDDGQLIPQLTWLGIRAKP